MTITVIVQTDREPAKVFAVIPRPGEAPQPQDFSDFGEVPPHSEIEFAVFDGRDILVTQQPFAQSEASEADGCAAQAEVEAA